MKRVLAWAVGLIAGLLALVGLNGLRGRLGWTLGPQTPEALARELRAGFRWIRPAGDGPFPVAVLLSGCDGPKSNLQNLAEDLRTAGWMSLIVDSHGPRGLDRYEAWRLVCAGQLLNGAERAADVAVALSEIRDRPEARSDQIALIGFSHGGWTALDFLALAQEAAPPPLLTEWPACPDQTPAHGVARVVLFYPYCGPASKAATAELPTDPDYLFLLVEGDSIASDRPCRAVVDRLRAAGATAQMEVFQGVTHGFDQETKNAFSALEFDPDVTEKAFQRTVAFLPQETSA